MFRAYPEFVKTIRDRHLRYMMAVRFIKSPPEGVRVREIVPPADLATGRATTALKVLETAYQCGVECGNSFIRSR